MYTACFEFDCRRRFGRCCSLGYEERGTSTVLVSSGSSVYQQQLNVVVERYRCPLSLSSWSTTVAAGTFAGGRRGELRRRLRTVSFDGVETAACRSAVGFGHVGGVVAVGLRRPSVGGVVRRRSVRGVCVHHVLRLGEKSGNFRRRTVVREVCVFVVALCWGSHLC